MIEWRTDGWWYEDFSSTWFDCDKEWGSGSRGERIEPMEEKLKRLESTRDVGASQVQQWRIEVWRKEARSDVTSSKVDTDGQELPFTDVSKLAMIAGALISYIIPGLTSLSKSSSSRCWARVFEKARTGKVGLARGKRSRVHSVKVILRALAYGEASTTGVRAPWRWTMVTCSSVSPANGAVGAANRGLTSRRISEII